MEHYCRLYHISWSGLFPFPIINIIMRKAPPPKKYKITIMLKSGILDNAGKAVTEALKRLGFNQIVNVRIGKTISLEYDGDIEPIANTLTNDVMETYKIKKYLT